MTKPTFCRTVGAKPEEITPEQFMQIVQDPELEAKVAEISAGNLEKKRQLPAMCWQANFNGKNRANANAVSTGLYALDIDHVDNPEALFDTFKSRIPELGIFAVHKTPSSHGLRVVAMCRKGLGSIRENQFWLAKQIDVQHDAATCDAARLSYLVPWSYFLFFNWALFSVEPDVTLDFTRRDNFMPTITTQQPTATTTQQATTAPSHSTPWNTTAVDAQIPNNPELNFLGVPFYDINCKLVAEMGGTPAVGTRNTTCFRTARMLSNITDRNPELLFQICPRFGLPEAEVRSCCESACRSVRTSRIPAPLYKVLCSFGIDLSDLTTGSYSYGKKETDEEILNELSAAASTLHLPDIEHLPPGIREFVSTAPEDFREATAMVCLAVFGFLGSRLRSKYLDGMPQAPSFIVNIIAPAASGKSEVLRVTDFCLRKIREMDDEGRAKEAEYGRMQKLLKNAKKQLEEPQPIVRDITVKVSVAQLLKRMVQAKGLHLISIAQEADTMAASNKAGSWSQKTDIYRIAQDGDGGRYGQDFKSDQSYNATCKMLYNLVALGTPGSMARAYPDTEDGLITRCIMVTLPDQFGKPMPEHLEMTPHQIKVVNDKIDALMAISQDSDGNVLPEYVMSLPWLRKAISEWIENQRILAIRENDRARDQFRRRAALIAFRAGMVAAFLWGKLDRKRKDYTIEFSTWVAEFVLQSLINRYSKKVNDEAFENQTSTKASRYPSIFDMMGDTFTLQDLRHAASMQSCRSPLKSIIYFWNANGLIEKQGDTFVKLIK